MNCAEIRKLLHAYADGELDLVRSLEVEQHLKSCASCAAGKNSLQSLRSALQNNDLAYPAPNSLRNKVRKMARDSRDAANRRENNWQWLWKWLAVGATALAVLTMLLRPAGTSEHDQLVNEAVASHVRSMMANHLTDVASSERHTVKPWFDGKLDFAPSVKDLADQGFPLLGGRLDYLGNRAVAALVYRRDKHIINVFIWPATMGGTKQTQNHHGYNAITFDAGGFHYCLVSDVEQKELERLAALLSDKN